METRLIGIAWYRAENYSQLLKIFENADVLPGTYEQWLVRAKTGEDRLQSRGFRIVRVDIDPEQFPAWCHAHGYAIDAKALAAFSEAIAQDMTAAGVLH